VLPWLERLGGQRRPRGVLLLQGGRARGAALLVAERLGGRAGPRVLRPPGLGVSDYLDLLLPAESEAAAAAVERLLDWLLQAGGWDLLDLPNLPAESPTAGLVTAAAERRGLRWARFETHRRPYLALGGSWEQYLASRPQKLRYNLRARRRQLGALGALSFRHYRQPDEVQQQLPLAFALHARRWQDQYTSTLFSRSAAARRFYAEAAARLAGRGWLELATLEQGDRLLAFALCFLHQDRLYYYLPAFDPDYARFAPSTSLLAHLIESSYARGLAELDFMLGDEVYKAQWASGSRGTLRLLVAAPGARGRLAIETCARALAAREQARRSTVLQRLRRHGLGRVKAVVGGLPGLGRR
jgi:CelD/BcsL family acetyltransferase involved in cellulose biosynthesis